MNLPEGIRESGQLFLFGTGLFLAGLIFRKLRKLASDLHPAGPISQRAETK